MSILHNYPGLPINFHGMPCCNGCRHCWALGSPDYPTMPLADIQFVLKSLAEFRDRNEVWAMPLFFKEPTIHPKFIEIVRSMKQLGFINEDTFWATNGYGLARMDDGAWQLLKESQFGGLQLMFYGSEEAHDAFANRSGAYRDLMTTVEKANKHGIPWSGGMIAHSGNLNELTPMVKALSEVNPDPEKRIGWFIPNCQGRARSLERPTLVQMREAGLMEKENRWWASEASHVGQVLGDSAVADLRYRQIGCLSLTLDLEANMDVFCGGGCDSNGLLGLVPELKQDFKLGNLRQDTLDEMVERFFKDAPKPLKRIWDMTAGELAGRFGDRENGELFYRDDLVKNKWGAMALREAEH